MSLFSILFFLNLQFLFFSHPFFASLNLIFNLVFWIPFLFYFFNLNWVGYLLSLLYLGGLLILFIYFSSILPQQKNKILKKKNFLFLLFSFLIFFQNFFIENLNFSPNIFFFLPLKFIFLSFSLSLIFLFLILIFINNFLFFNRLPLRLL